MALLFQCREFAGRLFQNKLFRGVSAPTPTPITTQTGGGAGGGGNSFGPRGAQYVRHRDGRIQFDFEDHNRKLEQERKAESERVVREIHAVLKAKAKPFRLPATFVGHAEIKLRLRVSARVQWAPATPPVETTWHMAERITIALGAAVVYVDRQKIRAEEDRLLAALAAADMLASF